MFPPTKVQRIPLPTGDRGIAVTIQWMQKAAADGARDPQIRQLALSIVQPVPNKDSTGEIRMVYGWVKQNIKFRGEWDETVQAPEVTIKFGAGDCDDHAVLIAALLEAIGYQTRFKTVGVAGEYEFTHVYAEALNPDTGQWTALDTTVDDAYPGWQPPDITRAKEWKGLGRMGRLGRLGRMRRNAPRRFAGLRRLGDAGDIALDINAAQPFFQAIGAQQSQNQPFYPYAYPYYGGLTAPPSFTASATPYPQGGGSVTASSSVPTWVWIGLAVAGGLVLAKIMGGRRR